jgi:hypothetical protein
MTSILHPNLWDLTSSQAYSPPSVSHPATAPKRSIRAHLTQAVAVMGIAAAGIGIAALFLADAPAGPAVVTPAVHHSTVLGRGNLPAMQLPTAAPVLPSRVRPPT